VLNSQKRRFPARAVREEYNFVCGCARCGAEALTVAAQTPAMAPSRDWAVARLPWSGGSPGAAGPSAGVVGGGDPSSGTEYESSEEGLPWGAGAGTSSEDDL
jgi:hypothetical protein